MHPNHALLSNSNPVLSNTNHIPALNPSTNIASVTKVKMPINDMSTIYSTRKRKQTTHQKMTRHQQYDKTGEIRHNSALTRNDTAPAQEMRHNTKLH